MIIIDDWGGVPAEVWDTPVGHTPCLCLDPVTLVTAGLGLLGGIAGTALSSGGKTPTPAAAPSMPAPAVSPQGNASTNKPTTAPSFLAAAAAPTSGNTTGQKTLLGA